jgi:hypothetical protein
VVGRPAGTLRPSPEAARTDREKLWTNGCLAWENVTTPRRCVFGNTSSSFTIALVGDSHLSHLFPGFERLANQRGWKLVTYVKVNCPFIDIPIKGLDRTREYTECATWNAIVMRRLRKHPPDITVTLPFRWIHPVDAAQDSAAAEGSAIGRMLAQVPGKRLVLVDTPWSLDDVPDCVAAHPDDYGACGIPQGEVLTGGVRSREQAVARVGGATYADLTRRICGGWPCRVVTGDILMFRDAHHLTATYAATLASSLGTHVDRALAS